MTRDEAIISISEHSSARRTICEVHREIYRLGDEKIKELVLEAFIMGKKMDRKLKEYKQDWDEEFFK